MMKKLLATLFAGAILFSLAACGGEKNQPEKKVSSIGEAGRQPAIVNDYRQGMRPYRQGDGKIHFGNPSRKLNHYCRRQRLSIHAYRIIERSQHNYSKEANQK